MSTEKAFTNFQSLISSYRKATDTNEKTKLIMETKSSFRKGDKEVEENIDVANKTS